MGVIHKLKPEIVDFIVKQKSEDPSLSCRGLVAVIEEQFGKKLSKSSVNNVLKELNLSSPVGRHGQSSVKKTEPAAKVFRLSEQKKKEMFSDVSQHCILADIKSVKDDKLTDGAGNIFLKAAEWELARKPVLEDLLQEYSMNGDKEKISQIAAVLGFLKAFHIESFEGLSRYEGQGLWALNNIEKSIPESEVLDVLDSVSQRQEFFLKFSLKVPQNFTQIKGFRFVLKDGSVFFLDARLASVWKNTQHGFNASLVKAVEILAKVLNNVQAVVLCSFSPRTSGKIQENTQIFDFFQSFENVQSKKIQKIELLGEEGQILGDFGEVPHIKRNFIAGIWPWEMLFQRILESKNVLKEGKISYGTAGRDLMFKEISLKWAIEGRVFFVRGILLFDPFMQVPFLALLTNSDPQEDAKTIVLRYCQRWPNMEQGGCFSLLSDPAKWKGLSSTGEETIWDDFLGNAPLNRDPVWAAIDQLGVLLDRFAKQQFFSDTYTDADFYTMQNRFYNLSGKISAEEKRFHVDIHAPEAYPYARDLHFAVQRINESGVETFTQQAVTVAII